jgi:hypothetical protein
MTNNTSLAQSSYLNFFTNNTNSILKKFPIPSTLPEKNKIDSNFIQSSINLNCSLFEFIGKPKLESKLSINKKHAEKEFFALLNLLKRHRIYLTYSFPFSIRYTYQILKENLLKVKVNDLKSKNYIQILNLEQLIDINLLTPIERVFTFLKIINSRDWKPLIELMDELVQIGEFQFGCPQLLEYQNRYFENWNNLELKSTAITLAKITENTSKVNLEILVKKHPKAKTQLLEFYFELNNKFDWWVIHKITLSKPINFKQ